MHKIGFPHLNIERDIHSIIIECILRIVHICFEVLESNSSIRLLVLRKYHTNYSNGFQSIYRIERDSEVK